MVRMLGLDANRGGTVSLKSDDFGHSPKPAFNSGERRDFAKYSGSLLHNRGGFRFDPFWYLTHLNSRTPIGRRHHTRVVNADGTIACGWCRPTIKAGIENEISVEG
jgi:hypothetical protein